MIQQFRQRFLTLRHTYSDPLEQQRAEGLSLIYVFGFISSTFFALFAFLSGFYATFDPFGIAILIITPFMVLFLYELVQRSYYRVSAIILLAFSIVLAIRPIISNDSLDYNVIYLFLPVVLAASLLGWRAVLFTNIALLTALIQRTFIQPIATGDARPIEEFVIVTQIVGIISVILVIFGTNIRNYASRFIDRFNILRRVAESMNLPSDNVAEPALVSQVIDVMRDQLNYNYAQVFLSNENLEIRQRIASGLSKEQVNVDNEIIINDGSAIYEALRRRETVTITRNSSEVRRSHLLPGLQTGIALPIMHHDQIIGVLDVQSESAALPSDTEMQVIEIVAQQLGTALAESRIIANLRETLTRQDNLIQRQQTRLLEFERIQRRGVASNWASYLGQRGIEFLGFDFDSDDTSPVEAFNLDSDLQPAIEAGDVTVTMEGDNQIVSAPILLRGQSLGAMTFRIPQGRQIVGSRQLELVRSVVQRLALALENQRLFEQSQAQAQRERKANEVGNLLLSTTDIETVLKLAVTNFNEALGAVQTKIHLQPDAQTSAEELS